MNGAAPFRTKKSVNCGSVSSTSTSTAHFPLLMTMSVGEKLAPPYFPLCVHLHSLPFPRRCVQASKLPPLVHSYPPQHTAVSMTMCRRQSCHPLCVRVLHSTRAIINTTSCDWKCSGFVIAVVLSCSLVVVVVVVVCCCCRYCCCFLLLQLFLPLVFAVLVDIAAAAATASVDLSPFLSQVVLILLLTRFTQK
jgi:hypothetical protein